MLISYLILTVAEGLFIFYLQTACEKIMRREFDQDYFQPLATANRLAFSSIRAALENGDRPVEYSLFRTELEADFLALTYMLKNCANPERRYSLDERLLMLYFRIMMFSFFVRHTLKLQERSVILKITAILTYFANVVGQRVSLVRFGNLGLTAFPESVKTGVV